MQKKNREIRKAFKKQEKKIVNKRGKKSFFCSAEDNFQFSTISNIIPVLMKNKKNS